MDNHTAYIIGSTIGWAIWIAFGLVIVRRLRTWKALSLWRRILWTFWAALWLCANVVTLAGKL